MSLLSDPLWWQVIDKVCVRRRFGSYTLGSPVCFLSIQNRSMLFYWNHDEGPVTRTGRGRAKLDWVFIIVSMKVSGDASMERGRRRRKGPKASLHQGVRGHSPECFMNSPGSKTKEKQLLKKTQVDVKSSVSFKQLIFFVRLGMLHILCLLQGEKGRAPLEGLSIVGVWWQLVRLFTEKRLDCCGYKNLFQKKERMKVKRRWRRWRRSNLLLLWQQVSQLPLPHLQAPVGEEEGSLDSYGGLVVFKR